MSVLLQCPDLEERCILSVNYGRKKVAEAPLDMLGACKYNMQLHHRKSI